MSHRRKTSRANRDRVEQRAEKAPLDPRAVTAAAVLAVIGLLAVTWWGNPYPEQLVAYWGVGTIAIVTIGVFVARQSGNVISRQVDRGVRAIADIPPVWFALGLLVFTTLLAAVISVTVFSRGASTTDELAQLWHARILLRGWWSLPVDPNPEFFSLDTVVDVGRWYSQFPIGGPLVLAVGAAIHAPWLVNPVLAGIAAVGLYQFSRLTFGELHARAIAIVFSTSAGILVMAGTWMNHVPALCLAACALAALAEWERSRGAIRASIFAAAIGLALGFMATVRPLDAVVVACVIGIFQLFVFARTPRRSWQLIVQVAAGVLGASPLLIANAATTGSPWRFGYDVLWGAGHRVGFHTDPYGNPHTLGRAIEQTATYINELNAYVLAWPIPALAVVVVALVALKKFTRWDALVLGIFVAQLLAYGAYWGEGEFLGPRFLFTAYPAIIVLASRAPLLVANRAGARFRNGGAAVLIACILAAWCIPGLPFNALGLMHQAHEVRRTFRIDIAGAVERAGIDRGLIFVREPFSARLSRRMWGLGVLRSEAAQLLANRDACSLLRAVERAEQDTSSLASAGKAALVRTAQPFVESSSSLTARDGTFHLSSQNSLTPECRAEIEADADGGFVPFGVALPLEPIDEQGRISGDVIYVADLGEHNAVLKERFGDRPWYRLSAKIGADGEMGLVVSPY